MSFVSLMVFLFLISCIFYSKEHYISPFKIRNYFILLNTFLVVCLFSFFVWYFHGLPIKLEILPVQEEANMSLYLTSVIAGLAIFSILSSQHSEKVVHTYVVFFLLSNVFLFFIYIALIKSFKLPGFLNPLVYIDEKQLLYGTVFDLSFKDTSFFAGFQGFVENFAEDQFVIFALAVLFFTTRKELRNKIFALISIGLALFFGLASSIKAFPINIILFFIILLFIRTFKKRLFTLSNIFILSLICLACYYVILNLDDLYRYFLIERLHTLKFRHEFANPINYIDYFFIIIGRPSVYREFWNVVETGGLFGNGPFIFYKIDGDIIPYHNLYFHIILSHGIIGLFLFILFVGYIFKKLFLSLSTSTNTALLSPIHILISLVIVLLLNNIKLSDFRVASGILTFFSILGLALLYGNIEQKNSFDMLDKNKLELNKVKTSL